MDLAENLAVDTADALAEGADTAPQERDFEAEARKHGWTPIEEFKGDKSRFVDAKTFVERADNVMPFLKKKTEAQDREIAELKRTIKQSAKYFEGVEQRAYERAVSDIKAKHAEAVESGDVAAADRAVDDLRKLDKEAKANAPKAEVDDDPAQARKELNAWMADNDWYVLDDKKRAYADMQADLMGPAAEWDGGQKAWLEELGNRVGKRFADKPVNPVNTGGNRPAPGGGGKTFADLPAEAKAMCDRFVKQGVIKSREDYVKTYQW